MVRVCFHRCFPSETDYWRFFNKKLLFPSSSLEFFGRYKVLMEGYKVVMGGISCCPFLVEKNPDNGSYFQLKRLNLISFVL